MADLFALTVFGEVVAGAFFDLHKEAVGGASSREIRDSIPTKEQRRSRRKLAIGLDTAILVVSKAPVKS